MFKTEMYRIFSRKLVIAVIAFFIILEILVGIDNQGGDLIDDGRVYGRERTREAVAREKEIATEFTGPLTEETVRKIWEKYGAPCDFNYHVEDAADYSYREGGNRNFCNTLIAGLFCQEQEDETGEIILVLSENLTENPYLQGDYWFAYVGNGWYFYWDEFLVAYVLACLVIIIALSPSFSEDYACRTAGYMLSAAKGRYALWRVRILAGCLFSTFVYWFITGLLFILQLLQYGAGGLQASCGLTGLPVFWQEGTKPLWEAILFIYLFNWIGAIILSLIVLCVSARSRQSFSSVLWSLALYVGPFLIMRVILFRLPMEGWNMLIQKIIYSMPLSYGGMMLGAPPWGRCFLTACELIAAVFAILLGIRAWCRHQVA